MMIISLTYKLSTINQHISYYFPTKDDLIIIRVLLDKA